MSQRDKSILLQVAFKQAVGATLGTEKDVKQQTGEFYNMLLDLHKDAGIDLDAPDNRGGFQKKEPKPLPEGASKFVSAGTDWIDYRAAKTAGSVKAAFPDFKSADYKQSVWLEDRDGNLTDEGKTLVEAAQKAAPFGS